MIHSLMCGTKLKNVMYSWVLLNLIYALYCMVRVPLDWTISTRTRKGGGCYISKLLVTIFVGIGLVIKLFMN